MFNRSSHKKTNRASLSRDGPRSESACSSTEEVEQNIHELEEVFGKLNFKWDKKISATEVADIMRPMGSHVLQVMMWEAGMDGDGYISLQEYMDLNTKEACVKGLKNAFKVFDLDRNGSISADELYQVLRGMGEVSTKEECKNIIDIVDRNGDGL
ncbi:hypothetical protein KI387_007225, partial [Taxus chinensis]